MPNMFEELLNPDENYDDPLKRKATAAILRRQNALGVLGQIMGTPMSVKVGAGLQEHAQTSLKDALAKQKDAREQKMQAERYAENDWYRKAMLAATDQRFRETDADRDASRALTATGQQLTQEAREQAADEKRTKVAFDQGTTLRTEYDKRLQAMQESVASAQTLLSLSNANDIANNPQAQTAMVFAFGKALDPNSTVREGEYKLFEQARGLLESWGMTPERIKSGARLSPGQMAKMLEVANIIVSQVAPRRDALDEKYYNLAVSNQLDPAKYGLPGPPKRAAAPEGAIGTRENPIKIRKPQPVAVPGAAPPMGAAPPAQPQTIKVDF